MTRQRVASFSIERDEKVKGKEGNVDISRYAVRLCSSRVPGGEIYAALASVEMLETMGLRLTTR